MVMMRWRPVPLVPLLLLWVVLCGSPAAVDATGNLVDCRGEWVQHDPAKTDYNKISHYRGSHMTKTEITTQQWLNESCPVDTFMFNCYYHILSSRVVESSFREWIPSDPSSCRPFEPLALLHHLRNRTVSFMGDSIMGQTWISMICALYPFTKLEADVHWDNYPYQGIYDHHICPEGKPHCQLRYGNIYLPAYDIHITYDEMHRYVPGVMTDVIINRYRLTSRDIVLLNYGVHYNSGYDYYIEMKKLSIELNNLFKMHPNSTNRMFTSPNLVRRRRLSVSGSDSDATRSRVDADVVADVDVARALAAFEPTNPHVDGRHRRRLREAADSARADAVEVASSAPATGLRRLGGGQSIYARGIPYLYMAETTPQHFPTTNGYYNKQDRAMKCVSYHNMTYAIDNDWRNILLHKLFPNAMLVNTSTALYTQWDAHLAADSYVNKFESADCTHYCISAGVFEYLRRVLFNWIRQLP